MEVTGVSIGSRWTDSDEMVALARRADDLGYDTIWAGEAWGRDAFTVLTMIACNTRRIRLGTGIATVFSRTPALLAQSIASLDVASRGRAVLGLGTSGRAVIEGWHGLKYERPLERTREYVDIIRAALGGQRVDYQGSFFRLSRFRMTVSPVQDRIPIFVAALGPRNLALTGELADGWLPIWVHLDHLPRMKKRVEEAASGAGRSIEDVTVAPLVLCVATRSSGEVSEARHLLLDHLAYYIGGMGTYYYRLFKRYGYGEEAARVRDAWSKNEREKAASLISDDMLDKITIFGDAEACRARIEEYRSRGADMPVVAFPHNCPRDVALHTLEVLAPGG